MDTQTTFMEVITDYAMLEIADIRLQKELAESPARFFRKMSFYMLNAIPRFNRPPEAREWLRFTAPTYDDFDYTVPEDYNSDNPLTIATALPEYGLVSAVRIAEDGYGSYEYLPISFMAYDAVTGNVTIPAGTVSAGDQLAIDFYNDGVFERQLNVRVKRILGLLVQLVWENRFVNDFLLQQPKIKDRSFDVGNEANHMRAATERIRYLNAAVNAELRSFEQYCAYDVTVTNNGNAVFSNPAGELVETAETEAGEEEETP